jgi:peptidase E
LLVTLYVWKKATGSISVDSISNAKSEMFYWLAITFSQTLGTALGDWFADTNGLGYLHSAFVFGTLLLFITFLYFRTKVSKVLLFWGAFILTRPLGAVVGDFLDKPFAKGGLNISRPMISLILLVAIAILIAFIDAGYAVTDLDLRNTNEPTFKELLTQTDVLHVCGGSVSYLGWLLKEKNVTASLLEAVMSDNVVYTGTSAGSMIVSKDLAMFSYDDREEKEYVEKGFDKKGLGLIPWTIAPHSDSQDFTESHKRVIDELVTNPTAVVLLHDNQALWVENDAVRFLSA